MARLDELEALLAAAPDPVIRSVETSDDERHEYLGSGNVLYSPLPDAELIAAAVNALPDLIAVARAAEAFVGRIGDGYYISPRDEFDVLRAALDRLNEEWAG